MSKKFAIIDEEGFIIESVFSNNDDFISPADNWIDVTGVDFRDKQYVNGQWLEPQRSYLELRKYPSLEEQADMQYWDAINGTTVWQDTITAIKAKYPKE